MCTCSKGTCQKFERNDDQGKAFYKAQCEDRHGTDSTLVDLCFTCKTTGKKCGAYHDALEEAASKTTGTRAKKSPVLKKKTTRTLRH